MTQLNAAFAILAAAGLPVTGEGSAERHLNGQLFPVSDLQDLVVVWPELAGIDPIILSKIDAEAKYHVYIDRQKQDISRQKRDEALDIPTDFNFEGIPGLSHELCAKFQARRPATVGQASRIEGVTPAALLLLAVHARRHRSA